jgi:hypothetical protein
VWRRKRARRAIEKNGYAGACELVVTNVLALHSIAGSVVYKSLMMPEEGKERANSVGPDVKDMKAGA